MNQHLSFIPAQIEDISDIVALEQDPENKSFVFPYTKERHREVIHRTDEFLIKVIDKTTEELEGFLLLALTEKRTR